MKLVVVGCQPQHGKSRLSKKVKKEFCGHFHPYYEQKCSLSLTVCRQVLLGVLLEEEREVRQVLRVVVHLQQRVLLGLQDLLEHHLVA